MRHLSDLDREADHLEQALAHAEQASALYRANGKGTSPDLANALRLKGLALDGLRKPEQARTVWTDARDLYARAEVADGVAECERRLDAD